ncbi:CDP-glycerol glycerophosphotransferase family protein [Pseudescherichia vulneris]
MSYIKECMLIFINSVIAFISSFNKLDEKRVVITSTQNISYNFNSKYFFEYLNESSEWRGFSVFYVINNDAKCRELNSTYNTDRFISSQSFKGALFCLGAKFWISSTFELPVNSLYRNSQRIVLHLGHGVPLKKIGLNEEQVSFLKKINRLIRTRQFTDIVCYSPELKNSMVKTFANEDANYIFMGQPRNDGLIVNKVSIRERVLEMAGLHSSDTVRIVLYAPTWRPYASTCFFPFEVDASELDELLRSNNIYIFLRSHPFYPSKIERNIIDLPNIISFNSNIAPEICDYLGAFDSLITDYSSIYIDYLIADRKIGFIPYDKDEYIKKVGFCYDYEQFTPGAKIHDYTDLVDFLLSDEDLSKDHREKIRKVTNTKASGNCYEISKYLKNKIN